MGFELSQPFKCEACGLEGEIEGNEPLKSGDDVSCPQCRSRYITLDSA
jgi:DNA-directed RNA polymerase subunit RPC12/RpoP